MKLHVVVPTIMTNPEQEFNCLDQLVTHFDSAKLDFKIYFVANFDIKEFEENNKHGFDNRDGAEHVSGVYRWIDIIYKNQLVNYGKRLMYEFMVPEPSRFFKDAIIKKSKDQTSSCGSVIVLDIKVNSIEIESFDDVVKKIRKVSSQKLYYIANEIFDENK